MTNSTIHLTGGIDVGNGYVKGVVRDQTGVIDTVDLPSAVTSTSRSTPKVPLPDTDAYATVVDGDFFNMLDASLSTPLVAHADRRIFGRAALFTPGSKFTEFEVIGRHSKADQELSKVLTLGVFAATALRSYLRENKTLPDHELSVDIRAGLALPISEYVSRRSAFAAELTGLDKNAPTPHLVTIKNFATPVTVRLRFIDVQVLPEGASAQFAITDKGEPLAEALLADLRAGGSNAGSASARVLEGITAADLVAVRNTIGIDLGEGTCNFPVFTDGTFNAEAAGTLEQGFGTALTNAMERMAEADNTLIFTSRKQLADFLQQPPSSLQRARWSRAVAYVEEESGYLVEDICSRFADVLSRASATTEVVYVYGGGSGPIKHLLWPAVRKVAGDIPVLYLDARYSRHLNREGLFIAASTVQERADRAEQLKASTSAKKTAQVA